ncbi:hypothetical protein D5018_07965 [Parashewanella curva]|uniref:Uncharacterized protein n=1 Tax=Parashewanella curva TaxID=2338552 RepID=A0A3L8Q088_9GAMM|nr:hypothetical protein [Parashewanella curva]RLV60193.1 hypothetical protein D5018_07965 [Parashewanella curva]
MKKIQTLLLLAGMTFSSAQAIEVCSNHEIVGVKYQVSEIKNGKQTSKQVNVWRNKNAVLYEYPQTRIAEYWYKTPNASKEFLQLTRYFDEFKRGIEYQSKEIRSNNKQQHWNRLYHVFTPKRLAKYQKSMTKGQTCTQVSHYHIPNTVKQVEWLEHYQLPKSFTLGQKGSTYQWTLIELVSEQKQVLSRFSKRGEFKTTDYADVGDNESDEFLSQMINQGF